MVGLNCWKAPLLTSALQREPTPAPRATDIDLFTEKGRIKDVPAGKNLAENCLTDFWKLAGKTGIGQPGFYWEQAALELSTLKLN